MKLSKEQKLENKRVESLSKYIDSIEKNMNKINNAISRLERMKVSQVNKNLLKLKDDRLQRQTELVQAIFRLKNQSKQS